MVRAVAGLTIVLVLGFFGVWTVGAPSLCDEAVRGTEEQVTIGFKFVQEGLEKIDAGLASTKVRRFEEDIEFDTLSVQALNACKEACRLLDLCRKWQFWKSPAEACPLEFQSYNSRIDSTLQLLERLAKAKGVVETQVSSAASDVNASDQALRKAIEEPGASVVRITIARRALGDAEKRLDSALSKVKDLVSVESGS